MTTSKTAEFLLRIYLEKRDPRFKPALDKAIDFILEAQYPLGGWPQRYPLMYNHPHGDVADYTAYYTFNDDAIWGNLEFLIDCYQTLGEQRLLDPIGRAMNFFILTQQGNPQGGWAEQYDMDLKPAQARSYEPAALMPGASFGNALHMLDFYRYTGDRRFLSRIPDVINWLESSKLPENQTMGGKYSHATFIEVGTNRPLYAHRTGTGVADGQYWVDYSDEQLLAHYGGKVNIDLEQLKNEYNRVNALSLEEAIADTPLKPIRFAEDETPQQYFLKKRLQEMVVPENANVTAVVNSLDAQGRWLTRHEWISRPYARLADGTETNTARTSDEAGNAIRDTSTQEYITVREYIKNMNILLDYVRTAAQRM